MTKVKNDGKEYEGLIYKIYKELEPFANVKFDDSILGINSKAKRQIDISIRTTVANHKILIIVQAKNLKKRADIKILGEFNSVIEDTRASKGILICSSGFTVTAKEYAKNKKIDICSAHDASNKKWETEIKIPVIKTSMKVKLKIQHHYLPSKPMTINGVEMPFPQLVINAFLNKWENDDLSKEPGTHYIELDRELIKLSNSFMSLRTAIEYTIEHRYHFKFFKPVDYRGFKGYITENFIPSFIEFKEKILFLMTALGNMFLLLKIYLFKLLIFKWNCLTLI